MISDGDIAGTEAVQIIQNYMDKYGGLSVFDGTAMQDFFGQSTLEGYNSELQNAMGEGYNEGKSSVCQTRSTGSSGEAGQKMQEVYSQMGRSRVI